RRKNDPVGALADYDAALRLDTRSWEAMQNKADVLADDFNRPREAIQILDRLLEMYPGYVVARAGRGVYFARLGEKERAMQDADQTLHEEKSPFRLYQMAGLFAQLWKHDHNPDTRGQALRLLSAALRTGFADFKLIEHDADIAPLKDDPEFKRL